MGRVWELPANSHTINLAGLNEGQHVFDSLLYRFSVMYIGMSRSSNPKLLFLSQLANEDHHGLLGRNINSLCKKWSIKSNQICNIHNVREYSVFGPEKMAQCMHAVWLVHEIRDSQHLTQTIYGLTQEELNEIVAVATTDDVNL